MLKIIVAGGRTFRDYQLLSDKLDKITTDIRNKTGVIQIVSGCQESVDHVTGDKYGADYLGERYATETGCDIKRFPADWDKYGKSAGWMRNKQMAEYADYLVAFWDGQSSGTKMMIQLAREHGLQTRIIRY